MHCSRFHTLRRQTKNAIHNRWDLIMPSVLDTCKVIFSEKAAEKMGQIPSFRWKIFSLHLDDSTDIANKTLLHIDILTGTVKWLQKISWTPLLTSAYYWIRNIQVNIRIIFQQNLNMSDCVLICTGGEANMADVHGGLDVKFKKLLPHIQ
jgi:hypothetical protein